jgi:poly(A) polymerase
LLIRYRRSEDGRPVAKALVYTQAEHRIDKAGIDPDALRIVERLRENGQEAYIVGGAVRDLLLGRRPKDFDIVTDAQPQRIKRIFRNARIIGRRFRLVHVYAGPKLFEVCTFRSIANGTVGNEYGTMDEDALRRDFTLNALYYDPLDALLIDYVGGFKDIEAKRVKPVIPLATIFKEDPVRMIRCVKYAVISGFHIPFSTRLAIKRDSSLLAGASSSRLTEEFVKILGSGFSEAIFRSLSDFDLLRHILPGTAELFSKSSAFKRAHLAAMGELDALLSTGVEKKLSTLLSYYMKAFLASKSDLIADGPDAYALALAAVRDFFAPLNPPRAELESALIGAFREHGYSPSPKPRRRRSYRAGADDEEGKPSGAKPAAARPSGAKPSVAKRVEGKVHGPARRDGKNPEVAKEPKAGLEEPKTKKRRRRKPHSKPADGARGGNQATP